MLPAEDPKPRTPADCMASCPVLVPRQHPRGGRTDPGMAGVQAQPSFLLHRGCEGLQRLPHPQRDTALLRRALRGGQ